MVSPDKRPMCEKCGRECSRQEYIGQGTYGDLRRVRFICPTHGDVQPVWGREGYLRYKRDMERMHMSEDYL